MYFTTPLALVVVPSRVTLAPTDTPIGTLALNDLAFIKIDAQGADGEVMIGAAETIRRCRSVIVFEWETLLSRHFSVSFEEVTSLLSSAGYRLEVLKVHNEKQTDYLASPPTG